MAATSTEWATLAKRHLKATLARHEISYADLAQRLTEMGLPETDSSIGMKVNRGTFPAWWLFAVMRAVGAHTLHLE